MVKLECPKCGKTPSKEERHTCDRLHSFHNENQTKCITGSRIRKKKVYTCLNPNCQDYKKVIGLV